MNAHFRSGLHCTSISSTSAHQAKHLISELRLKPSKPTANTKTSGALREMIQTLTTSMRHALRGVSTLATGGVKALSRLVPEVRIALPQLQTSWRKPTPRLMDRRSLQEECSKAESSMISTDFGCIEGWKWSSSSFHPNLDMILKLLKHRHSAFTWFSSQNAASISPPINYSSTFPGLCTKIAPLPTSSGLAQGQLAVTTQGEEATEVVPPEDFGKSWPVNGRFLIQGDNTGFLLFALRKTLFQRFQTQNHQDSVCLKLRMKTLQPWFFWYTGATFGETHPFLHAGTLSVPAWWCFGAPFRSPSACCPGASWSKTTSCLGELQTAGCIIFTWLSKKR